MPKGEKITMQVNLPTNSKADENRWACGHGTGTDGGSLSTPMDTDELVQDTDTSLHAIGGIVMACWLVC